MNKGLLGIVAILVLFTAYLLWAANFGPISLSIDRTTCSPKATREILSLGAVVVAEDRSLSTFMPGTSFCDMYQSVTVEGTNKRLYTATANRAGDKIFLHVFDKTGSRKLGWFYLYPSGTERRMNIGLPGRVLGLENGAMYLWSSVSESYAAIISDDGMVYAYTLNTIRQSSYSPRKILTSIRTEPDLYEFFFF